MRKGRIVLAVSSVLVIAGVVGAIFVIGPHFPAPQSLAEKTMAEDKVVSMLMAINKIRKPLDIQLDCEEFVYPYLGRHDEVGYYIDLFAASGINSTVVRQHENYHIGFEIRSQHLKKIPNSKFGSLDVVAIVLVASGRDPNSTVHSCKAILKAAPPYL